MEIKNLQLRLYRDNPEDDKLAQFVEDMQNKGYKPKQILTMALEALQEKNKGYDLAQLSNEIQELKELLVKCDIKIEEHSQDAEGKIAVEEVKTIGVAKEDIDPDDLDRI